MEKIKYFHGVEYSAVLFDLVMDKLFQLISGCDNVAETKNKKQELIVLLENMYSVTVDFRDALRSGNQSKFNTALASTVSYMQNIYSYYEKNSYSEQALSQIALGICNQFNVFVPLYNEFSNNNDRMSKSAQQVAQRAEFEFNKLVSLILKSLNELKQH